MKRIKTYEEFNFGDLSFDKLREKLYSLVKKVGNIFHFKGWKFY